MTRPIALGLTLMLLCSLTPGAAAQCLLCGPAREGANPARVERGTPLRVDIETQLDFSRVTTSGAGGEISVDPASGARRVAGDLVDLGGMALTGSVRVTGDPGARVRVILPASIDLENGRGDAVRVTGIATDLGPEVRLGPDGVLRFRFGGRLQVRGLTDGDYRGRVPISVEYE